MAREGYVQQLENLRDDLIRLGSMVEHAMINALRSLEQWDTVAAARVIVDDREIDRFHRETERQVVRLIAEQGATRDDPRMLVSAFAIAGELERIGDYACSIARRVERMTVQTTMVPIPSGVREIATITRRMLNTSLESFLLQDLNLAYSLRSDEDRVDELEKRVRDELLATIRDDPQRLEAGMNMIDIVHALERVADRTTNIGERVIYLTTDIREELNP